MHKMEELKYMLCEELEPFIKKGKVDNMEDLQAIDLLTHSIKSLDTIIAMEDAGYSREDYSNNSYGNSYARGRGSNARRDSMGRYASTNYGGGLSSRNYSRDDIKSEIMETLREMGMDGNR